MGRRSNTAHFGHSRPLKRSVFRNMEHSYVDIEQAEMTVRHGRVAISKLSLVLGVVAVAATAVCATLAVRPPAVADVVQDVPKFAPSVSIATPARNGQREGQRNGVVTMSHFSSVKVGVLKDEKSISSALKSMGLEVSTGDHVVRGYDGETTEAQLIIKQTNGKDIGFRKSKDGSFELVADLQFWKQPLPVDAFLEKLTQRYALSTIRAATADAGFQLVNQAVDADGAIRVEVAKYVTPGDATTVRKFVNSASSLPSSRAARRRLSAPGVAMSHFTKVQTSLKDKDMLVKTLTDMGAKVSVSDDLMTVRGYDDETEKAHIVIEQPNGKDLGFRSSENGFELVADLQFWEMAVPADVFLEKLTQRYALNTVTKATEAAGFQLVSAKNTADGSIKIEVSKFRTAA